MYVLVIAVRRAHSDCAALYPGFQVYCLTPLEQPIRLQHEELALLQSSNINLQCLCLIGIV
jgi:hypothetical protein